MLRYYLAGYRCGDNPCATLPTGDGRNPQANHDQFISFIYYHVACYGHAFFPDYCSLANTNFHLLLRTTYYALFLQLAVLVDSEFPKKAS